MIRMVEFSTYQKTLNSDFSIQNTSANLLLIGRILSNKKVKTLSNKKEFDKKSQDSETLTLDLPSTKKHNTLIAQSRRH